MDALHRAHQRARELLTVTTPAGTSDPWLFAHAERVRALAGWLAGQPEHAGAEFHVEALDLAALYSHAGWAVQVQAGEVSSWQVLGRPTSELQRELAASLLKDELAPHVSADVLFVAMDAIRQCNDRTAAGHEPRILSEAEHLADMGLTPTLRQFRQYQWEGKPLTLLIEKWRRQVEYQYWEIRIRDFLHTDAARQLARRRLAQVDRFITSLAAECAQEDAAALPES